MTNCNAEKEGNKNMSEKEQKSYYAVIPANVRYDRRLKANEKLLYGEITALTNERGYCWAGNKYFSDLYGVTPQAVSKWINGLKNCGYISIEYTYKNGTKEIESRIIKLASTNVSQVVTNDSDVLTNVSVGINKSLMGYKQKVKDNNTYLNNTNINNNIYSPVSSKQDKIPYQDIVEYLNLKANTKFRFTSEKTRKLIKARINENFTVEDFKTVIDNKCDEWLNDDKMKIYLRPETLFGSKFESYLKQKKKKITTKKLDIDISDF